MPEPVPLTQADQDLMGQVARFAERRAENGVYLNLMHSKTLAQPVIMLFAIGDQALALQSLVMKGAQPEHSLIEVVQPGDSNEQF